VSDADGVPVRERWGIRPDDVVVGLVSTLYPHEGVSTLVAAVALLAADVPALRLLVVGDGPDGQAIRAAIAEHGIGDRTVLTGRVPFAEVPAYYAAIDVFCVPRVQARVSDLVTPLKPVEAMATGRALVASDVGGLREVVRDGVTGVLVTPDDAVALAEGIRPLLYHRDLRARLGEAARNWVGEHRTWAQVASRYRDAYASLSGD
jgi:glycosyltransferase involved in cell wall biosynthesis